MALNFKLIPDYVYHDAVMRCFSGRRLVKSPKGYNFRCPICGDSRSNPNDRNGWVLFRDGHWQYHCFKGRCAYSKPFIEYLQEYNPTLHQSILFHAISTDQIGRKLDKEFTEEVSKKVLTGKDCFDDGELLPITHEHPLAKKALEYVINRKIPEIYWSKWFVAVEDSDFRKYRGGKGNRYKNSIIIPFYKLGGQWDFFQSRDLTGQRSAKYLNAVDVPHEYYRRAFVDLGRTFYLTEGPIDSTFIENGMAFVGVGKLRDFLKTDEFVKNKRNAVFFTDNYNVDAAGEKMRLSIVRNGYQHFDWNKIENNELYKDINDLVMAGVVPINEYGQISQEFLKSNVIKPKLGTIEMNLLDMASKSIVNRTLLN